tara:strand:+ start:2157 stop:2861 length:705 start_codon:yes stop_codon:yes gene_type:complete
MAKYLRFQVADGQENYQDVKMDSTIMFFAKSSTRTFFVDENGNPNGYVCYELNQADNAGADSVIPYLHKELKALMEMDNDSPTQDKAIYRTIPFKIPIPARTVECTEDTWAEWIVEGVFTEGGVLNGVAVLAEGVGAVTLGSAIPEAAGEGSLATIANTLCSSTALDIAFIKNATGTTSAGTAVPNLADYYYVGKTFAGPEGSEATYHVVSKKVFTTTEFTGRIIYGKTTLDAI